MFKITKYVSYDMLNEWNEYDSTSLQAVSFSKDDIEWEGN